MSEGLTYREAGVDIDAGNRAVELMKKHVRATYRPEVMGDIGGFGGLFALNIAKYKEPVLVSGTTRHGRPGCARSASSRHPAPASAGRKPVTASATRPGWVSVIRAGAVTLVLLRISATVTGE